MEEKREREGGEREEETMDESTEERESDLDESEEESSGKKLLNDERKEMDDEDCERRRGECLDKMSDLEKQLFRERLNQVKVKLDEVLTGKAGEYREPLARLKHNMTLRTQVAGNYYYYY
uniref:BRMS1 like transcriptional repressor b n=1 Tax=Hucho hucho TaxID=62062 RepID=A0A4W5L0L6_9TELE